LRYTIGGSVSSRDRSDTSRLSCVCLSDFPESCSPFALGRRFAAGNLGLKIVPRGSKETFSLRMRSWNADNAWNSWPGPKAAQQIHLRAELAASVHSRDEALPRACLDAESFPPQSAFGAPHSAHAERKAERLHESSLRGQRAVREFHREARRPPHPAQEFKNLRPQAMLRSRSGFAP